MKLVTFTVFVLIALLGTPALAQDGGIIWEGGATRAINVGWNFVTATNCLTEYNGTTTLFFVFTRNPDGLIFVTNNPTFQILLSPACQSGNLVGFFVSRSGNNFIWNQVYTHTHR